MGAVFPWAPLPWVVSTGFVIAAGALDGTQDEHPDFSRSAWCQWSPMKTDGMQSVDRTQGESMEFHIDIEYINETPLGPMFIVGITHTM